MVCSVLVSWVRIWVCWFVGNESTTRLIVECVVFDAFMGENFWWGGFLFYEDCYERVGEMVRIVRELWDFWVVDEVVVDLVLGVFVCYLCFGVFVYYGC